jgi:hypothetical protein
VGLGELVDRVSLVALRHHEMKSEFQDCENFAEDGACFVHMLNSGVMDLSSADAGAVFSEFIDNSSTYHDLHLLVDDLFDVWWNSLDEHNCWMSTICTFWLTI